MKTPNELSQKYKLLAFSLTGGSPMVVNSFIGRKRIHSRKFGQKVYGHWDYKEDKYQIENLSR